MSNRDPDIARVIIDVQREQLPQLLTVLGSFVLEHDIRINFGDVDIRAYSQPESAEESPAYDPELVTFTSAGSGESDIPVITQGNLATYAQRHGKPHNQATVIMTSVEIAAKWDPALRDLLYGLGIGEHYTLAGIHAERLAELTALIAADSRPFRSLGPKAIEFLRGFGAELVADETRESP
jgi:hypothetical protein